VTFAPGSATAAILVPILDDRVAEPAEQFRVRLAGPVNAALADDEGTGTITDLDLPGGPFRGELAHGSVVHGDLVLPDSFHLLQRPYSSYEAVVDAVSGDVDPLVFRRVSCPGAVVQNGAAVGTGASRALRWENGPLPVANETLEIQSGGCTLDCGPDDVYRLRFHETTAAVARINNTGSQVTVLVLQNATSATVLGHVYFWNAAGTLRHALLFSLPPRGSLAILTPNLTNLGEFSGSATVTHDGPYGALAGKAVALEPATGYSFDTPLLPRRH
jgi:hypothetical protein